MTSRDQRIAQLKKIAGERIIILDGGYGTMIQTYKLSEADYRGKRFHSHASDLKGNNDLLSITRPEVIAEIHRQYLEAGADIIETNSFSSNRISMEDYDMADLARELNVAGAKLAKAEAEKMTKETPDKPRFVAGAIGPTTRSASISPDVNNPGARNVNFEQLRSSYKEAAEGLIEGGVDILLVETIFDTLNAKAALFAIQEVFEEQGFELPVIVSGTIVDRSGRNLSGQTAEAFWYSVRHVRPFAIGLNCALGAKDLRAYVAELSRIADTRLSVYPNAGLPNEFGGYDETPQQMADELESWAAQGMLNLVGGCCGTTPDHIRAIAKAMEGKKPRAVPEVKPAMRLSGLEPLEIAA